MRSSRFASALVHKNAMSFAQHFSELKFSFTRSEEHTSELQSQSNLVCRLLLEKKKKTTNPKSDITSKNKQLRRSYKLTRQRPALCTLRSSQSGTESISLNISVNTPASDRRSAL